MAQWCRRFYLCFIAIISFLGKEPSSLFDYHLNKFPLPKDVKFVCNWLTGSGDEHFSNFIKFNFTHLGKRHSCPSFNQKWILFTQWCFVPNLVKIEPVVLDKKILSLSILGKGHALHLNEPNPLYLYSFHALCQVLLRLGQFWRRK